MKVTDEDKSRKGQVCLLETKEGAESKRWIPIDEGKTCLSDIMVGDCIGSCVNGVEVEPAYILREGDIISEGRWKRPKQKIKISVDNSQGVTRCFMVEEGLPVYKVLVWVVNGKEVEPEQTLQEGDRVSMIQRWPLQAQVDSYSTEDRQNKTKGEM